MDMALPILGVAFAATCAWLSVRIINRSERWAERTLAAIVIGLPVLYVASFGPACWISSRTGDQNSDAVTVVEQVFQPLLRLALDSPEPICGWTAHYGQMGAKPEWYFRGACFSNDCFWANR